MRALIPALIAGSITAFAQTSAPVRSQVAFEAASVKRSAPGSQPTAAGAVGPPAGGNVRFPRGTLRTLVAYAFNLQPILRHDPEPVGGPGWADKDVFDIVARGPSDLTLADARRMMLTLLEERFKLRVHVEPREIPVYVLVLAKKDGALGPGLKRSASDCSRYSAVLSATGRGALAQLENADCRLTQGGAPALALAAGASNPFPRGALVMRGTATMTEIVNGMARDREMDRPIVDRTGLTGTFDVDLHWVPARSGAIVADPVDVLPLVTAVQEQLGLKLDARREAYDVVVIDSAEPPTPD